MHARKPDPANIQFPSSLSGPLNTQYHVTEALTLLAFNYAKKFNINTDGLSFLSGREKRRDKIKRFIFKSSRNISIETKTINIILS